MLGAAGIEHAERVAVMDAHDLACERGRLGSHGSHARQADGDDDGKKRRQCVAYFALAAALDRSSRNLTRLFRHIAVAR